MPVQVPDEVTPTDDLSDEALNGCKGSTTTSIRILGTGHHLDGVEETQVHRRREQRVRHPRITGHHRVLVRAEGGESVVDEVIEKSERLSAGRGKSAWAAGAQETHLSISLPAIQILPHLLVDLVLLRPKWFKHAQRCRSGWRFLIIRIEVPATARRLITIHQHI